MAENWSGQKERGTGLGIMFLAWVYRLLGRTVCRAVMAPGVFFFYLNGGDQRRASRTYLDRAYAAGHLKNKPGFWTGYWHYMAFSGAMLDKLASWMGHIKPEQVEGVHGGLFDNAKKEGRGGLVMTAHLGNPEVIRAVATLNQRYSITVLVHTENASNFQAMLERFNQKTNVRLMQIKNLDIATAVQLSERVENGEWLILTADRVAAGSGTEAMAPANFLGAPANFPIGPFVLGSALKCPSYFMVCARKGNRFKVTFREFADPIKLPRRQREAAIGDYVQRYADMLEEVVAETPMQWFNFYDYWAMDAAKAPAPASEAPEPQVELKATSA